MIWSLFQDSNQHIFKKIGLYTDQSGIYKRYKREKSVWDSHLNQTKAFILTSAIDKQKGKCAILGSGWMLDVPLIELSQLFGEVWLFDIHHPKLVREKFNYLSNIRFFETDLSGYALEIYRLSRSNTKRIEDPNSLNLYSTFDFSLAEFDFVVSCNILNQLDIILIDYLKGKKQISSAIETNLRTLIQDSHILRLPVNKSCLITDVEELWLNQKDEVVSQVPLIYAKHFNFLPEKTWIWHFDTHYTYREEYLTSFQVKAFQI